MEITLLHKSHEPAYRNFIDHHPEATIYHTLEWRDILTKTYQFAPRYVVALEKGKICGVFPLMSVDTLLRGKRLISLPFTPIVKPLITHKSYRLAKLFVAFLKNQLIKNHYQYVELKTGTQINYPAVKNISSNYHSMLLLDKSLKNLWNSFESSSVRWGIKRAQKSNLIIKNGAALKDYRIFYELEQETRKRQGSPIYPFLFFANIHKFLTPKKIAHLYLAYYQEEPIAGIITFFYNKQSVYAYGASVSNQQYLRLQPNNLLLWHAIQKACRWKCTVFDFGTTPTHLKGLLNFKKRWGTTTKKTYYQYLSQDKQFKVVNRNSLQVKLVSSIIKKSPKAVLQKIGPHLLKEVV